MRKIIVLLLFVLPAGAIFAEKLADLPDVSHPIHMFVEGGRLYIAGDTTVYLYSMKNYKLVKTLEYYPEITGLSKKII